MNKIEEGFKFGFGLTFGIGTALGVALGFGRVMAYIGSFLFY